MRQAFRPAVVWTGATGALILAVGASLLLGARTLSPLEVWGGLTGHGDATAMLVVTELRVPRTVLGLLAGAGLAVAGAVMQGITRNPIASPSVLGINAGASFSVVLAVHMLGIASALGYAAFALLGAALTAVLAYALATAGAAGPVRLALAGAVVATMFAAWTTTTLVLSGRTLEEARHWLAGSLVARGTGVPAVVAPLIGLGLLVSFVLVSGLDALVLGDEQATALGQRPGRIRLAGAVAVVLLAGAAVAAAGPIAFVGLVVPHVARLVVGGGHARLLPACALAGPILLLGADVLARLVARPAELDVGVVTAIIGAPVLIGLSLRLRDTEVLR